MFSAKFTKILKEKGLTAYRVAQDLEINPGTVTKWTNGVVPEWKNIIKLADYLDVDKDYFLDNTSPGDINSIKIGVVNAPLANAAGINANARVNFGTPVSPNDGLELPDISELKIISIWRKLNLKGQGELMVSLHTISSDETNLVK